MRINGPKVRLEPASKVPADLLAEIRQHKAEIVRELQPAYGDGKLPPLRHPPGDETELRRLLDYLADPTAFSHWLEHLMAQKDAAERN